MLKVIFINTFTVYSRKNELYEPGTNGFFQFGMGQFIAQEFNARHYPVKFENWRMDWRINCLMEKEIDGLFCRIFPSKNIKHFGEYSKEFIRALKQEAQKQDVVFHFFATHQNNYNYFSWIVRKKRVLATHLGGSNPLWDFQQNKNCRSLIYYYLEKYFMLRSYDHFVSICEPEVKYYKKIKKSVSHLPAVGLPMEKSLVIKNRAECRKKLGLPLDKKILLQVGRATKNRGFDWILELVDHYQKKNDYFLAFVGVYQEDEFYHDLVRRAVYVKGYMLREEIVDYYNAADLLYYLPNERMDLNFAGTSYVPLEALACGTPVVATTFHHFPGKDVGEVSRIPDKKEDVIPMIEDLLTADIDREKCRAIVLKSFSWDMFVKEYWKLYSQE